VKASATVLTLLVAAGCGGGGHTVLVAPRLNLLPYGSVGLVTFSIEKAKGSLNEFATRRFEEYVLAAQSGIEVQEFSLPDSAQALGGARGVPVVFLGHLKVSDVKPSGGMIGLTLPHVEATVTATLSVELRSTKSGGTLWRSSAVATEKVGQLAIVDGQPEFAARDPNDAPRTGASARRSASGPAAAAARSPSRAERATARPSPALGGAVARR